MTQPVARWDHDPNHPTATSDPEAHERSRGIRPGTCFGCWCYSCGGRTDEPRLRRGDDRQDLTDPDDHRWCYE